MLRARVQSLEVNGIRGEFFKEAKMVTYERSSILFKPHTRMEITGGPRFKSSKTPLTVPGDLECPGSTSLAVALLAQNSLP